MAPWCSTPFSTVLSISRELVSSLVQCFGARFNLILIAGRYPRMFVLFGEDGIKVVVFWGGLVTLVEVDALSVL